MAQRTHPAWVILASLTLNDGQAATDLERIWRATSVAYPHRF
jgi:hypothetical protein